jgi:hypothetical protein
LKVADNLNEIKKEGLSFKARDDVIDSYAIAFAHALIKAVEQEADVVAWGIENEEQFFFGKKDKRPFAKAWKPYLALPLVSEE